MQARVIKTKKGVSRPNSMEESRLEEGEDIYVKKKECAKNKPKMKTRGEGSKMEPRECTLSDLQTDRHQPYDPGHNGSRCRVHSCSSDTSDSSSGRAAAGSSDGSDGSARG